MDPTRILSPETAFEAWGQGRRFSIHPCGTGRVFWFATLNRPANGPDPPHGRQLEVREHFSSWHEPIPSVIAAASEIIRNDIYDRAPVKAWGRGRITLLGDAAHPTTPNLGQGACQALEDAVVLADRLRASSAIEPALREYEEIRGPRTRLITNESYRLGRISQSENPMIRWGSRLAVQVMPPSVSWWSFERFLKTELPVL